MYSGVTSRMASAARIFAFMSVTAAGGDLLVVLVEARQVREVEDLERRSRRHQALRRLQRHAVEGGLAQAAGDAEDLDVGHDLSLRSFECVTFARQWPQAGASSSPYLFTFRSIASQISAAMSAPPKAFTWRMPVGEVTLISVR